MKEMFEVETWEALKVIALIAGIILLDVALWWYCIKTAGYDPEDETDEERNLWK